ncbi:MFS transporter [Sphingobium sp. H39-3-25]|uniref:MFS transporter n=1 Tax=Sphingobium arseniciresistens TaxID=3030834 RepID=UPI0023B9C72D|nr:MFS transporter [Sphingobium arseniciresistens]
MLTGSIAGYAADRNHPLAIRMAAIAFLTNNITVGALWGSFSVLLAAVEMRLGVGRELSTLGIPLVNLVLAISAPFVGVLAARSSLRLVVLCGGALSTGGYLCLALSHSYVLYLVAYGLMLGPGMAIGVILPSTLVTRWFRQGRGRALGFIGAPIVITLIPVGLSWVLLHLGLSAAYLILAMLAGVTVIAGLFIIDRPPERAMGTDESSVHHGTLAVSDLLRSGRFWCLAIPAACSTASSITLSAHMVPMASSWGFSTTMAAFLISTQAMAGIAGTILFGWVADRIGAVRTFAVLLFNEAALWTLFLAHPPYPLLVVLVALIGLHGYGVLPVLGLVLSRAFGAENFSQAYGLFNLVNLPFSVVCVPAVALVYTHTGSYSAAILGQIGFFAIAITLIVSGHWSKSPAITAT